MPTAFDEIAKEFSNAAHNKACEVFYPELFNNLLFEFDDNVQFESGEVGRVLDGMLAIDRIAKVELIDTSLRAPIILTIQERFRKPQYMSFADLTITEWNTETNKESEFHKLAAHMFVYGFYDSNRDVLIEVMSIDIVKLMLSIIHNKITYRRGNNGPPKNQDFISIKYTELLRSGTILKYHGKRIKDGRCKRG